MTAGAQSILPADDASVHAHMALAAVRARPGITTEEVSAILLCDVETADQVLDQLARGGAVDGLHDEASGAWNWRPEAWCHNCGCTTEAACEGGCGWSVAPGEVVEFGELAGICTRCA